MATGSEEEAQGHDHTHTHAPVGGALSGEALSSARATATRHAPAAKVARRSSWSAGVTDALAGFAPARKEADAAGGGDAEGIETEGEDQADRVEAAVKGGKSAKSALGGAVTATAAGAAAGAHGEEEAEHEERAGAGPAPVAAGAGAAAAAAGVAAKGLARKKVALKESGSKFSTGLAFSPTSMEKHGTYTLWDRGVEIPIPAVPGLVAKFDPSVTVSAKGGVDWHKKVMTAALGVNGGVGIGFGYGKSELAQVYGTMEGNAGGGFEYSKNHAHWELDGNIKLSTNFKVGVKLAGGVIDHSFEFGKCELGTLTGISFKDGKLQKDKLGWEWGDKPKEFFKAMKKAIKEAKKVLDRIQSVGSAIKHLTGW